MLSLRVTFQLSCAYSAQERFRPCGAVGFAMLALSTAPSRKLAYCNPTLPPDIVCPWVYGRPVSALLKLYTPGAEEPTPLVKASMRHSPPTLKLWLPRTSTP